MTCFLHVGIIVMLTFLAALKFKKDQLEENQQQLHEKIDHTVTGTCFILIVMSTDWVYVQ